MTLKFSLINVLNSGIEINTGTRYCYKTAKKQFLVGTDFCRMCCIEDKEMKIFDTVEEAVEYVLSGRSGQAE